MILVIRFWAFVLAMTVITLVVARLFGYTLSIWKVFASWLLITLSSIAALYLFSVLLSSI